jgi:hypothetical protein
LVGVEDFSFRKIIAMRDNISENLVVGKIMRLHVQFYTGVTPAPSN